MPVIQWLKRREVQRRAEELLRECCQRLDLPEKAFGKGAREWIGRRRWEDDAAEMRQLVYYATLAAPGSVIEASHFPPRNRLDHEAFAQSSFDSLSLEEAVRHKVAHFFERLGRVEVQGVYDAVLAQVERPLIEQCLAWAGGNQLKAARALGINRNTLRRKMKDLGIPLVRSFDRKTMAGKGPTHYEKRF
ncbi:MAG: helix-turn-helix domain-containing protein [bacterium]